MPFFEYFALEPLANRDLLDSGPGAAPLDGAADAYAAVGQGLGAAATNTDGLMATMREAWPGGMSSQRAQAAFAKHNHWVRDQATNAARIADLAEQGSGLHKKALDAMPSRAEIEATIATMVASAAAMSASGTVASAGIPGVSAAALLVFGTSSAVHAAAEAHYQDLKFRAALTMAGYELGATLLLVDLVSGAAGLTPPPPIVVPGPGLLGADPLDAVGPLQNLIANGPDSPYLSSTSVDAGPAQQGPGGGTDSTSNPGSGGSDPGPTGSEPSLADPQQPMSPENGWQPGTDNYGTDSYGGHYADSSPLMGTAAGSPTLAAFGAGAVGLGGLGMVRGSLSTLPGAGTGFRLPANWSPAGGTAFGASSAAASPGTPARPTANRVSAPSARMRRRRDEETSTGKVFAPGEQIDIPELERPPAIGVIEYEDSESESVLNDDFSLAGILDRFDDEDETETGHSIR